MKNKYALYLLIAFISFSNISCKKLVEKIQEDAIMSLITNNLWTMQSFTQDGVDLTSSFSGYDFQFNKDLTIYALKTGSPSLPGTWAPNSDALTITTNFPSATGDFTKVNGTFKITNSTLTYVKANRFEGPVEYKLWLVKK